jgi:ribosomal protein S19E (S16A)
MRWRSRFPGANRAMREERMKRDLGLVREILLRLEQYGQIEKRPKLRKVARRSFSMAMAFD